MTKKSNELQQHNKLPKNQTTKKTEFEPFGKCIDPE